MTVIGFKIVYILMMKCTFMHDNADNIRKCQDKVFRETVLDLQKGEK